MKYVYNLFSRLILALVVSLIFPIYYIIFYQPTILIPYWILILFGYGAVLGNETIVLKGVVFNFISACVAASAYYLLTLLILTTKGINLKKSIKLFVYGSLIILGVNIIRILGLIVARVEGGSLLFDSLHLLIWKFVASVFVVLLWIWLTKKFKIRNIPIYSDLMELYRLSKKSKKRRKSKRK